MKIDLTLEAVLKHYEYRVKKIDNFDYKLKNGTWNDHDILVIKDLQYKADGLERLENLIEFTSTGNVFLHEELKMIKTLVK